MEFSFVLFYLLYFALAKLIFSRFTSQRLTNKVSFFFAFVASRWFFSFFLAARTGIKTSCYLTAHNKNTVIQNMRWWWKCWIIFAALHGREAKTKITWTQISIGNLKLLFLVFFLQENNKFFTKISLHSNFYFQFFDIVRQMFHWISVFTSVYESVLWIFCRQTRKRKVSKHKKIINARITDCLQRIR